MLNLGDLCRLFATITIYVQNTKGSDHITDEMRDLIVGPSAESMPSVDRFMIFHELRMQRVNLDRLRSKVLIVAGYINTKWKYLTLWDWLTTFDFNISAIAHLLNVETFVLSLNAEHPKLRKLLFRIINGIVEHPEFSEFCRRKREEESSEESEEESSEESQEKPKFFSFAFLDALQEINAYYRQHYAPIKPALVEK